jgi:hypothetical protein
MTKFALAIPTDLNKSGTQIVKPNKLQHYSAIYSIAIGFSASCLNVKIKSYP